MSRKLWKPLLLRQWHNNITSVKSRFRLVTLVIYHATFQRKTHHPPSVTDFVIFILSAPIWLRHSSRIRGSRLRPFSDHSGDFPVPLIRSRRLSLPPLASSLLALCLSLSLCELHREKRRSPMPGHRELPTARLHRRRSPLFASARRTVASGAATWVRRLIIIVYTEGVEFSPQPNDENVVPSGLALVPHFSRGKQ